MSPSVDFERDVLLDELVEELESQFTTPHFGELHNRVEASRRQQRAARGVGALVAAMILIVFGVAQVRDSEHQIATVAEVGDEADGGLVLNAPATGYRNVLVSGGSWVVWDRSEDPDFGSAEVVWLNQERDVLSVGGGCDVDRWEISWNDQGFTIDGPSNMFGGSEPECDEAGLNDSLPIVSGQSVEISLVEANGLLAFELKEMSNEWAITIMAATPTAPVFAFLTGGTWSTLDWPGTEGEEATLSVVLTPDGTFDAMVVEWRCERATWSLRANLVQDPGEREIAVETFDLEDQRTTEALTGGGCSDAPLLADELPFDLGQPLTARVTQSLERHPEGLLVLQQVDDETD